MKQTFKWKIPFAGRRAREEDYSKKKKKKTPMKNRRGEKSRRGLQQGGQCTRCAVISPVQRGFLLVGMCDGLARNPPVLRPILTRCLSCREIDSGRTEKSRHRPEEAAERLGRRHGSAERCRLRGSSGRPGLGESRIRSSAQLFD